MVLKEIIILESIIIFVCTYTFIVSEFKPQHLISQMDFFLYKIFQFSIVIGVESVKKVKLRRTNTFFIVIYLIVTFSNGLAFDSPLLFND